MTNREKYFLVKQANENLPDVSVPDRKAGIAQAIAMLAGGGAAMGVPIGGGIGAATEGGLKGFGRGAVRGALTGLGAGTGMIAGSLIPGIGGVTAPIGLGAGAAGGHLLGKSLLPTPSERKDDKDNKDDKKEDE